MDIVFEKEYLRELYETGKTTGKKYRFQPQVAEKYRKTVDLLESATSIEDLFFINSLHYEVLKGDKKGISSVRVNNQYRIEFTVSKEESETIITVCNIKELSNHYK
ncbi:MAG: type II toxin-antitoxin system RelE/ParE family toxin [Tannerellaceae bacterium]|jgi:proteic killer suppression protein|nr:type II toxin-antitoxin system RelE/ParE family toxin [Tannerellaceae bacterium]